MNTQQPSAEFREWQELIDASPDADLHSINTWFTLGQKCRVNLHTLLDRLDLWSKEGKRDLATRAAIGNLLMQMTPEREFDHATDVLEERFHQNANITNAELVAWWKAGQRSMRTPGALVDRVRKWLDTVKLSPHNQELLVNLLHDYEDDVRAPARSRVLDEMTIHNVAPITGTAATVFSRGVLDPADERAKDRRNGNPPKRRASGRGQSAVA